MMVRSVGRQLYSPLRTALSPSVFVSGQLLVLSWPAPTVPHGRTAFRGIWRDVCPVSIKQQDTLEIRTASKHEYNIANDPQSQIRTQEICEKQS